MPESPDHDSEVEAEKNVFSPEEMAQLRSVLSDEQIVSIPFILTANEMRCLHADLADMTGNLLNNFPSCLAEQRREEILFLDGGNQTPREKGYNMEGHSGLWADQTPREFCTAIDTTCAAMKFPREDYDRLVHDEIELFRSLAKFRAKNNMLPRPSDAREMQEFDGLMAIDHTLARREFLLFLPPFLAMRRRGYSWLDLWQSG